MLDDLLDLFDRKKRKPGASGGLQGMLSSIVGDDDARYDRSGRYPARRHGFGDSDDSHDSDDRDFHRGQRSDHGYGAQGRGPDGVHGDGHGDGRGDSRVRSDESGRGPAQPRRDFFLDD